MDEKERKLRTRLGKHYDEDTGTINWKAYVDTGVNKPLWSWPWKRKAKKGVTDTGDLRLTEEAIKRAEDDQS